MPSFGSTQLIGGFLFGSVGFIAFIYGKRMKVWAEASQAQKDFMTWPTVLTDQCPSFKTKYFGDPIDQFASIG